MATPNLSPDDLVYLATQMNQPDGTSQMRDARQAFRDELTVERMTQAAYVYPLAHLLLRTDDPANIEELLWSALNEAERAGNPAPAETFLDLLKDEAFEPLRRISLAYILTTACNSDAMQQRQRDRINVLAASLKEPEEGETIANFILRHAMSAGRQGLIWADWSPHYCADRDTPDYPLPYAWIMAPALALDMPHLPKVAWKDILAISASHHVGQALVESWWSQEDFVCWAWQETGPFALPDLAHVKAPFIAHVDALAETANAPASLREACREALWAHLGGQDSPLALNTEAWRKTRQLAADRQEEAQTTTPETRPRRRPRA
jgi:hypothetical protein